MLQQTRVEVVVGYYRRWLRQFPTIKSLARAPYSRVLKVWEGLGYYARACYLHRAAKILVSRARWPSAPSGLDHTRTAGPAVPTSVVELMQLPGIGRYTAGAIASIGFGTRAAVVDGNVARVFARVFGVRHSPWAIAEQLLPQRNCGDFNQALMELGALVCLPATPRCERCPLRSVCLTHGDAVPVQKPRRMEHVTQDVLFVHRNGSVLLRQRPHTGLLAGMWELPAGISRQHLLTLRHSITNHRITLRVFADKPRSRRGKSATSRWLTRRELNRVPMPAGHRRALNWILGAQSSCASARNPGLHQ
jgi:A/G-specific adenine glycosylase